MRMQNELDDILINLYKLGFDDKYQLENLSMTLLGAYQSGCRDNCLSDTKYETDEEILKRIKP